MSIAKLYAEIQKFDLSALHISRTLLRDRALSLSGRNGIKVMKTAMDLNVCRGFYLSARNAESDFVRQHGSCVIVLGRGQNECWDRFIIAKELMHLFDDPYTSTTTAEQFGACLDELSNSSGNLSPAGQREYEAMWLAMAMLCPESCRGHFLEEHEAKRMTFYDIALRLKVPEVLVPILFDKRFDRIVKPLVAQPPQAAAAE